MWIIPCLLNWSEKQWRIASTVRGKGQSSFLDSDKFAKIGKKRETIRKNWEKREKSGKKSGKRKIVKKMQKSGRFFHFSPPDR